MSTVWPWLMVRRLRRGWPLNTPPTVPGPPPQFHCWDCKHPVRDGDQLCPSCAGGSRFAGGGRTS
jgi:hypothetical protein